MFHHSYFWRTGHEICYSWIILIKVVKQIEFWPNITQIFMKLTSNFISVFKSGFLKQKPVSIKINIYSIGLHLSTHIQKWEFILLGCGDAWDIPNTSKDSSVFISRVKQIKAFFLNCLNPENEETRFLCNIRNYLSNTASHSRQPASSATLLQEPQSLHVVTD
jgi:hypothetical protein